MTKRRNVSKRASDDIILKSARLCCVCKELGKQIHHIDGNSSNNETDNLVLLCLNCHDEVSSSSTISRQTLTPGVLKELRDKHYEHIALKYKLLEERNETQLNSDNIFQEVIDALYVHNLHNNIVGYSDDYWTQVQELLDWLDCQPFEKLAFNAKRETLEAIGSITSRTRRDMPSPISFRIKYLIIEIANIWEPYLIRKRSLNPEDVYLMWDAAAIASDLVYDGALYCKNYTLVVNGSEILRNVLRTAVLNDNSELQDHCLTAYRVAEDGCSRSNLEYALEFVTYEKQWALNNVNSDFIEYPEHLLEILEVR